MEIATHKKTALMIGANGLLANTLLDFLLAHDAYKKVIVFSSDSLKQSHPKLEHHKVNFNQLNAFQGLVKADDVYCCKNISIRRGKGSEALITFDYSFLISIAKWALRNGANQFLLVSSAGASEDSWVPYNRVKGEVEQVIKKLDYWAIHIFQAPIILGEHNSNRLGEQVAARISRGFDFLTGGIFSTYRPIEAEIVANAMIGAAQQLKSGIFTYPAAYLQKLANQTYGEDR